jgi:hypothetical protein
MMYGHLWSRRLAGAGFAATLLMAAPISAQAQALPGCQMSTDFAQIVAKIGASTVGDCVANELTGGTGGDRFQSTSRGLLILSGAGNWTAFTDGQTTWINDPTGAIATASASASAAPAQSAPVQNPGQIPAAPSQPAGPHPAA